MEWIELDPGNRSSLREVFANYPYRHGNISAVIEGGMGTALVDNPDDPKIGLLQFGHCNIFAGEPIRAYVEEKLKENLIVPNGEWEKLLKQIKGDHLHSFTRVAFEAGPWDRNGLQTQAQNVPDGFVINRVTEANITQFSELTESFVYNFPSHSSFLEKGVGFYAKHGTQIVSGCSSFLIGGGKLEIEICTHRDFRRRGLATAVAATLIEHCLAHYLEPCWDAANEWSAGLAEKLGFIHPKPYTAYRIKS